jgi:hypothetical protein
LWWDNNLSEDLAASIFKVKALITFTKTCYSVLQETVQPSYFGLPRLSSSSRISKELAPVVPICVMSGSDAGKYKSTVYNFGL